MLADLPLRLAGALAAFVLAATPLRGEETAPVTSAQPVPPRAAVRPKTFEEHGVKRVDPYYWLRDDTRKDPEVLAYLEAENAYTDAVLAPTEPLQEKLFDELVGRRQAGRRHRAVPQERLVVLPPLRGRPGVRPDPPPARLARRRRRRSCST